MAVEQTIITLRAGLGGVMVGRGSGSLLDGLLAAEHAAAAVRYVVGSGSRRRWFSGGAAEERHFGLELG